MSGKLFTYFLPALILTNLLLFSCRNNDSSFAPGLQYSGTIKIQSERHDSLEIPFIFSSPVSCKPGEKYPLVIALHDYGSSAQTFHEVWKPACDSLGLILLTPQGENRAEEGIGYSWGENTETLVLTAAEIIMNKFNIDPSGILLTGYSMGGMYAYQIAGRHKLSFKGFAALCSPLDQSWFNTSPLLRKDVKAYISHGEREEGFLNETEKVVARLRDFGYKTNYVIYPGLGHQLPEPYEKELISVLDFLLSE